MLDKPKDSANLMSLVWANNGGGNVFLSKNSNKWIDKKINWYNYESVLDHIKNQQLGEDIYWTPLCFNDGNSRKSTNVKDNQGCLFVDMDELNVESSTNKIDSGESIYYMQSCKKRKISNFQIYLNIKYNYYQYTCKLIYKLQMKIN